MWPMGWAESGQSAESLRLWSPWQPLSDPEPGSAPDSFLGTWQRVVCVCARVGQRCLFPQSGGMDDSAPSQPAWDEGLVFLIYPWNCGEPCWGPIKSPARADCRPLRHGWAGVELFVWGQSLAGSECTKLEA